MHRIEVGQDGEDYGKLSGGAIRYRGLRDVFSGQGVQIYIPAGKGHEETILATLSPAKRDSTWDDRDAAKALYEEWLRGVAQRAEE